MSARVALPVALVMFSAVSFAAPSIAGPWSLAPGEYVAEVRGTLSSSVEFFDADGEKSSLFRDGEQEERGLVSHFELGWKKRLNVVFELPFQSVTRRLDVPEEERTVTGFGDGLLGFRYRLANGSTAMALQLDWRPPLGYRRDLRLTHADSLDCGDTNGDGDSLDTNCARQVGGPRLGEGVQDVTLALHLGTKIASGFVQASGGYRYRFEDPDDQIVTSADAGFWVSRSLMVAGQFVGEFAATNAERRTDKISRAKAGPRIVYRVDPGLDFFAGSMHSVIAANALDQREFFVGLAFRQTKLDRRQGFLGGAPSP